MEKIKVKDQVAGIEKEIGVHSENLPKVLETAKDPEVKKEMKQRVESEINGLDSNASDYMESKLKIYQKYIFPFGFLSSEIDRMVLIGTIDDEKVYKEKMEKLLAKLDKKLAEYLTTDISEEEIANGSSNLILVDPSSYEIKYNQVSNKSEEIDLQAMVIQNKDQVILDLESIDKDILNFGMEKVKSLPSKVKLQILESLGDQNLTSGVKTKVENYKSLLRNDRNPKGVDTFILRVLSLMKNYKTTDLKLDSFMDGVLARTTSKRGMDFKENFDVSLGGVAELNQEAWGKTKEVSGEILEKFKDAPMPVKAVALIGAAWFAKLGYGLLNARDKDTEELAPISKLLRGVGTALAAYVGVNLVSDIYEKEYSKDYEKMNNMVKAKDYAEFLKNSEPSEEEIYGAGSFIETMYNPRIYNLEFSEVINKVSNNKSDSKEWVNYIDGKDLDVANTYLGIDMFMNRYNPERKGKESIYKMKNIPEEVKNEMKLLWQKVKIDQSAGSELSYRDVVLRFLALDPEFTFENERFRGNQKVDETNSYESRLDQIEELEGLYPTRYIKNSDIISSDREFERYVKSSREAKKSVLKKKLSFSKRIDLEKGRTIQLDSLFDTVSSSHTPYTNSVAVPRREELFSDFEVIDKQTGKSLDLQSEKIKVQTLGEKRDEKKPEMVELPNNVVLKAKRNVDLSKYVFYSKDIRFDSKL